VFSEHAFESSAPGKFRDAGLFSLRFLMGLYDHQDSISVRITY